MTFPDLMRARMAATGLTPPALRHELERVGVSVTRQSIHAWLSGERTPEPRNLVALFEVLLVAAEDRRAWARAAGHGDLIEAVAPGERFAS